jgi:hypothetical protein
MKNAESGTAPTFSTFLARVLPLFACCCIPLSCHCDGSVRSGATSNELRIRVARSRDTILGWTKSGASQLLLEFQRASTCREGRDASRSVVWTWVRRAGVLRMNATLGSARAGSRATPRRGRRRRSHATSARARVSHIERRHSYGARIRCGARTPTRTKMPVSTLRTAHGRRMAAGAGGCRVGAGGGTVRSVRA